MRCRNIRVFLFTSCLLLFSVYIFAQNDYYWVEGSGNWSDLTHWATTSGGATKHRKIPTKDDNIIFDTNSGFIVGSTDNRVKVDLNEVYCYNMEWRGTGANTKPKFYGNSKFLLIYGSLTLQPNMTYEAVYSRFVGTGQHTIKTAGVIIHYGFYFNSSGTWTLQDALNIRGSITLNSGTLNTNNQDLSISSFNTGSYDINTRRLILGASTVTVGAGWSSAIQGMVIESGTSHFIFLNSSNSGNRASFYSGQHLHKVTANEAPSGGVITLYANKGEIFIDDLILKESSSFAGDITTKKTTLTQGKEYTFGNVKTNLKITESLIAVGSKCDGLIRMRGNDNNYYTSTITLSPTATINAKGWAVSNIKLSTPITLDESYDYGNNQNITFNASAETTFYWVGGEGNWSDKTHWSTVNDGVFPPVDGGCLPGPKDNVVFNQNSGFTAENNKVKIDANAYCHDMTWTNVPNNPEINSNYIYQQSQRHQLIISGSLTLQVNMKYLVPETHLVSNEAETITTNGLEVGDNTPQTSQYRDTKIAFYMNGKGGSWKLQDPFIGNVSMMLYNGSFYTNNHNMRLHSFNGGAYYDRNTLLSLGTSQITLATKNYLGGNWSYKGGTNSALQAENSTIIFLSEKASFVIKEGHRYNIVSHTPRATDKNGNIRIQGGPTFGATNAPFVKKLTLKGDANFDKSMIFDELILEGKEYTFYPTYDPVITVNKRFQAKTSSCNEKMSLRSTYAKNDPFNFDVKSTATVDVSNLIVEGMKAITPLTLTNSVDDGSNENVTFPLGVEQTYFWVGGGGDWSDVQHWSLSSGGTYPSADVQCVPTVTTNVVFDVNSGFTTASNTVIYDGNIYCNDMKWDNAPNTPIFKKKDDAIAKTVLSIYGSLTLQKDMKLDVHASRHTVVHFKSNKLDEFIKTNGNEITHTGTREPKGFLFYFKGTGSWTFLDDFAGKGVVLFPEGGTLDFNNKKMQIAALIGSYNYSDTYKIILGSSLVEIYHSFVFYNAQWTVQKNSSKFTLEENNSTIVFKDGYGKMDIGNRKNTNQTVPDVNNQYTNIIFERSGQIEGQLGAKKIVFQDYGAISQSFSLGSLVVVDTLITGSKGDFRMSENSLLQVNKRAYFSGSPCNTKKIAGGGNVGSFPKINILAGTTKFASITMKNIDASGSHQSVTIVNGNDLGDNTNVNFITEDLGTIGGLGPDVSNLTDFSKPYVINTDRFYTNPNAKIVWDDGSTGTTFSITESGIYNVAVTYDDGCYVTDKIVVRTKNPTPVFDCVREGDTFVSGTGFLPGIIKLTTSTGETVSTTVQADNTWNVTLTTPLSIGSIISATQNIEGYDSDANTHTVTVNIGEPQVPVANVYTNAPNGTINITEKAGYEYSVNGGAFTTTADYNNLNVGTYTVTARLVASPKCTSQTIFYIGTDTPPAFNCIRADDTEITGTGEPSATIEVALANGTTKTTTVQADKMWTVTGVTVAAGEHISVTQKIGVYPPSSAINFTVVGTGEPQAPRGVVTNYPNGSVTITPTMGYEYSFNGGAYTTTATYTGLDVGTYTITARLIASPLCTSASSVFKIENDIPTIAPSNATLCLGYTKQLEASVASGTWSIADATIAAVNSQTGMVTANKIGTTTITYTTLKGYTADCKVVVEGGTGTEPVLTPEPSTCVVLGDTYSYTFTAEGKKVIAQALPNGFSFKQGDMKVSTLIDAATLNIRMQMETASIVVDSKGNIFVAGFSQNYTGLIVKVTPDGTRTLYAGSETEAGERDGALSQALLSPISFMTIDREDNLYVTQGTKVKKINTQTNILEPFVDTQGGFPGQNFGLMADNSGNIYFQKLSADFQSSTIKKITPQGAISDYLTGVKAVGYNFQIDREGNFYIPDIVNLGTYIPRIVKVAPNGTATVIAGGVTQGIKDGVGTEAHFSFLTKLIVDESKDIYVIDVNQNTGISILRKVSATGVVATVDNLQFEGSPVAITISEGDFIIADMNTNDGTISLKKVASSNYTISSTGAVPEGTHSYTLAVAGKCGDSKKVITLEAAKPKFANCPENQEVEVVAGTASATVSWTPPTATDCCGGAATLTASHNPNDSFNMGVTTVTYIATDKNNNTSTCSFTITVKEKETTCNPITGITSVCLGGTTQLTASPTTGGTWSSSNTNVATVDNTGLVTGQTVGTNTITYTQGSCSESVLIRVVANPPVVLTPEPPTCVVLGDTYSHTFTSSWRDVTAKTLPSWLTLKKGDMKVSTLIDATNLNIKINPISKSMVTDSKGNVFMTTYLQIQDHPGFIVKVTPDGSRTLYAGSETERGERDGALSQALLTPIAYMATDKNDNIYITQGSKVKRIDTKANTLETVVDTKGVFGQKYNSLTTDDAGNVYFQTASNADGINTIYRITPEGVIGKVVSVPFVWGNDFQVDGKGEHFYIPNLSGITSNTFLPSIIKVSANGAVKVIAGGAAQGYKDGIGTEAQFDYLIKIALDEFENIYVIDIRQQERIIKLRKITPEGVVTTFNDLKFDGQPVDIAISEGDFIIADMNPNDNTTSLKKVVPSNYTISSTGAVPEGTHSYTLAVAGKCGDSEKLVTLEAAKPKFSNCPEDQEVEVAEGTTSATVSWIPPTATDCCGGAATLTTSHSPNNSFNIGVTTVTYTATDKNNNTATCSFTITVKEKETTCNPITGITSVCLGSTTQLTALPTGGTWSSSNANVATVNTNGLVTGNLAGKVAISYTVGGCTKTATFTVIPLSVGGSVSSDATVCTGTNSTTLTLSSHTGSVVRWESSTDDFATDTDIANTTTSLTAINLSSTTKYRAVVQSGSCSEVTSSVATITVNTPPVFIVLNDENLSICRKDTRDIDLNDYIAYTPQQGQSVQWYKDGVSIGNLLSTANLKEDNVTKYKYEVTEIICNTPAKGTAYLYIRTLEEQTLTDKVAEYCVSDATNINLYTVLGQQAEGSWSVETTGTGSYLNGNRFNAKAAYDAGVGINSGVGTYKIRFTANPTSNGCLQNNSAVVTIRVVQ